MPPKSIWRGPNAQHFTLVHRSQQDPLLHDAEASNRVLKSTPRRLDGAATAAAAVGSSSGAAGSANRAELERELGAVASKERKNVGEAAEYGVYFDDTEYDYMRHLRPIGGNDNSRRGGTDVARGEGEEVIMLQAPKQERERVKPRSGGKDQLSFIKDEADVGSGKGKESEAGTGGGVALPAEVLPSKEMIPRTFEDDKQTGIRPDMDPHLRQVLEALDDEAFLMRTARGGASAPIADAGEVNEAGVEEDATDDLDEEDFFGQIVKGGELGADEQEPDWRQLPPGGEEAIWLDPGARAARELLQLREEGKGAEDLSLESRVALFKKAAAEEAQSGRKAVGGSRAAPSSTGSKSIFGEKGASRKSRHAGAKARLAASFYAPSQDGGATAFSMSSSAMERNQGLTALDEQFARMEKIYEQEDDDESEDEDGGEERAPVQDENIEAIYDEFLRKNEVIGNRMRERLGEEGTTSVEKVDIIRRELGAMRAVDRQTWDEAMAAGMGPDTTVEEQISRDLAARRNARRDWDVETIQTTKTNVENHPRTIAASQSVAPSRVSRLLPDGSVAGGSVAGGTDRMARIKIDPRTGSASVAGYINIGARQARREAGSAILKPTKRVDDVDGASSPEEDLGAESDSSSESTGTVTHTQQQTVKRDRNESKEEKKARKQAAKEEKQTRKSEKAQRKADFKAAMRGGAAPSNPHAPAATATIAL